jgi:hypothetical protein
MKKVLKLIIGLSLVALSSAFAQTKEEKEVLSLVKSESEAYLKRDTLTWQTFFIHNDKLNVNYTSGWL